MNIPFSVNAERAKIDAVVRAAKTFAVDAVLCLPPEDEGKEISIFDAYFSGSLDDLMDGHELIADHHSISGIQDALYAAAQPFILRAAPLVWPDDSIMAARVMSVLRTGTHALVQPTTRTISFLLSRIGLAQVENAACLDVVVAGDDTRNEGDVFEAFQAAVTQWVNTSADGRAAWFNSSEDFNIGDLLGEAPDLTPYLIGVGILARRGMQISVDASRNYDTVLVDRHRVTVTEG